MMKTGLLWFDDDPKRDLKEKVLRAATHYEQKYGQMPNTCLVHPSTFNGSGNGEQKLVTGAVEVRPQRSVLPDHFWLGVAEDANVPQRQAI
jgi:hypothetical protein